MGYHAYSIFFFFKPWSVSPLTGVILWSFGRQRARSRCAGAGAAWGAGWASCLAKLAVVYT